MSESKISNLSNPNTKLSNFSSFVKGSIGGLVGAIISHPVDTIKTRIQSKTSFSNAIRMGKYYKGFSAPLVGIPFEKSIVFGFYDWSKQNGLNNFWSGIVGGLMSTIIVTPIEYYKINMQNKTNMQNKINIKNVYKGLGPTICREVPGFGIYFSTYNYLDLKYAKSNTKSPISIFAFGGLSGLAAWIFIYPSDLVKTQIQSKTNTKSITNIIKDIYIKDGLRGYYRGFHYAAIRAIFLHGGAFMGYEMCQKINI
jgi:solute carrier family 25 carnitine/acylcarnitine transporter 20/29